MDGEGIGDVLAYKPREAIEVGCTRNLRRNLDAHAADRAHQSVRPSQQNEVT